MNIFQKIAILHYIKNNKDKVEYGYHSDIGTYTGIHRVKIKNKGSVSIEMHRNHWGDTNFGITYNLKGGEVYSLPPCQLSFFDKSFVARMYSKMFGYYVAKNGMPVNNITR
ncbi:MAG: hypothetical protein IKN73_00140 [Alphaproteobacteria bacterium]|nr:hypothetical protein [Alphaproteobacteria bacterium]